MNERKLIELAKSIATEVHSGQFRRGGVVPYIKHPEAVAGRVGDDFSAQIVAWLHDVIEDTSITEFDLLDQGIPPECVEAVVLLTKTRESIYEDYLERIAESPLATKVKIADMISNLADNPSRKQLKKYSKGLVRLTRDL